MHKEVNIGDEVILHDGSYNYKCLIVKETAKSIGYKVFQVRGQTYADNIYWLRKDSRGARCLYKL